MEANYFDFMFCSIEKLTTTKISEEEKRKVMQIFKPIKVRKKQIFLKEGDIPNIIAFNVSGLLRCFYIDRKSNDITKYFCFEESIISYSGLIQKKESKYYIEALEDCLLMVTDYSSFIKLIEGNFFWLNVIKKLQEQILIYKEERESSFLLDSATQRYENFIKNYPNVEQRINLGYIASYLGISQVSLSRIRNKLKKI